MGLSFLLVGCWNNGGGGTKGGGYTCRHYDAQVSILNKKGG